MTSYVKSGGIWRAPENWVKVSGVWKQPAAIYAKSGGAWSQVMIQPTTLLLHCDGVNGTQSFPDSSTRNLPISVAGNAQISTAQSKFGGASAYFDGVGDYLYSNDTDAFDTPGDYTVEWFANFPARGGAFSTPFFDTRATGAGSGFYVTIDDAETLDFWAGGAKRISSGVVSVNVWHHIAMCRASGTHRLFVDGALIGSYADATSYTSGALTIGTYIDTRDTGSNKYQGYIDEFRFTKDLARYTAAFTPPAGAFSPYG